VPCALINRVVAWVSLVGFGAQLDLREVTILLPAAGVIIWMPVSIGGLGVREGIFVHLLSPRGLAAGAGAAVGLTRWTGELQRAILGGLLLILGNNAPQALRARGG
jgi:glycosyltransferase 2 family protein